MTLQAAKSMLMRERMDWNRPHLNWIADHFYRTIRSAEPPSEPEPEKTPR